ncbi:hypothetical protein Tco_0950266 [Tanacetum coccineum]
MNDVHNKFDDILELKNELLQMLQSFCEKLLQQEQAASIDQSPLQEMSLQEMEDLKQHYLDEMLSLSNDLQIKDYRNEKIDIRFRRECEDTIYDLKVKFNGLSIEINKKKEQPEDSLSMGDEHLSTSPEKESDEFIKSSVENLVPIQSESEDTSRSDSECILPSCDDIYHINVYEEKSVTFFNPLFNSNDDLTSIDDELLSDEDVPEDNDIECKVSYDSNLDEPALLVAPLSDYNEDERLTPDDEIEFLLNRDPSTPTISIVSILEGFTDEPPLEENDDLFDLESKTNDWKNILYDDPIDDLIFDPGGDIDAFLDIDIPKNTKDGFYDPKGDVLYLERLLSYDTTLNFPPKVFLDRDPGSLSDINDLKIMVKVFDPRIHETIFSLTYVSLPFKDRHYLFFAYVIRIFLLYFTNPVDSPFLRSSGSEDIIFDFGIFAFHFSSLKPVAFEFPMEDCSSICFVPNIAMI